MQPIFFTSDSFCDTQQKWSATEKEAFAVFQSVMKFDLYLRGAECILHCDHKPLDPFLSKGMKMLKLDQWAIELPDYNITFVHIKGSSNILADVISRLTNLDTYKVPTKDPQRLKVSAIQHITEVNTSKITP